MVSLKRLSNKIILLCWMITILITFYLLSASFVAFRVEFLVSDVWHAHEGFSWKTSTIFVTMIKWLCWFVDY